ncbi:MAG: aminotransferase class IV [Bacillota bacterium]|nr:aminotransferase class IV [Bacillota bacterium]MDP4158535.1 aminotransferase class IV [Bacillota bacterium]
MSQCETLLSHDRLALFGFGLFETLLVTKDGPLFVDLHWQRMKKGADLLGLKLPDIRELLKQIQAYEQSPDIYPTALRITLSGGAPIVNLPSQLIIHKRLIPYTPEQFFSGIRLHLLHYPRNEQSPLVSIKSTNYLENILAKEEAINHEADEGLWLNTQGYICEGTMSNIFFVKGERLFTPCLTSGCLPGTRRQILLDLAHSLQIPTHQGLYTLSDLIQADEVFMTNSLMGAMPIRKLGDYSFEISPSGSKKSLMRQLELAYKNLITNTSSPFYSLVI